MESQIGQFPRTNALLPKEQLGMGFPTAVILRTNIVTGCVCSLDSMVGQGDTMMSASMNYLMSWCT